ncbi:MAG: malonic semialdehyde reductase [Myxococcota bacterium]
MSVLPDAALQQLFLDARTLSTWSPQPVPDELLHRLYELVKLGPTSTNSHPTRFLFIKSAEAKEKLVPALSAGNVDKTRAAPVTVVVAVDEQYHRQMSKLFPARPELGERLAGMPPEKKEFNLVQNSGLEAGYLIMAARALGLDCGPMGGFERAKVDEAFFAGTSWRSVLLVNLGYGERSKLHPRLPRLDFADAAKIA